MQKIKSLISVIYVFSLIVLTVPVFSILIILTAKIQSLFDRKRPGEWSIHVARFWSKLFFTLMPQWKVTLINPQDIPSSNQAFVIVANHESIADTIMMFYLNMSFRFMAKDTAFKLPFAGQALKACGAVSVRRSDPKSRHRALEQCGRLLSRGVSVFLYPEGTRSPHPGQFLPFKSGAFVLAQKYNVPILPVVVTGAGDMVEKGSIIPRKSHARIKILPPIIVEKSIPAEQWANSTRDLMLKEHKNLQT